MREFNQRFAKLEGTLDQTAKRLEERMTEIKSQLNTEIASNMELVETKLKNLVSLSKEEREALKDELLRTDKRLSMAMDSHAEEQATKLNLLKKEYATLTEHLNEEMRSLKESVMSELQTQLGSMGDIKVSRDTMAEVLLEMAMKIKGESLDFPLEVTEGE